MSVDFLQKIVSEYGIIAVFAGTFLEGESVLVIAGAMASRQLLHPMYVWAAAAAGAWLGHIVWFIVGRSIGKKTVWKLSLRYGFSEKITMLNGYIEQNKTKAVIILQYLYGVRIIGAISFGISEIKFSWFAVAQFVNCMVWAMAVGAIGFFLGKTASAFSSSPIYSVWIAASIIVLFFIAKKILHLLTDITH
ncbi:MAG: hypothetical protein GXP60_00125 [Epsilonproteobacteria bacterium]|nr:hypothetical protein [Campylobacterota bacterium]